ncbi:MAG TPA: PAS domain S-box protein [Pyrinomonadaceae bacterium]|nr:PAS domain S-box protein [Pyrinomonadaceae bacterium]
MRTAMQDKPALYAKLIHSLDAIVWEADPETFQFTFVSPHAEEILGYPIERWLEPNFWRDHTHHDDMDWCSAFCMDSTKRGQDHEFEYRMIAADGSVVWLHDIVSVRTEAGGGKLHLSGIMFDITKRKQAQDELRKQTETLQKIVDHIPVMISFRDAAGRLELVNHEWERTLGWSLAEAQNRKGDVLPEIYPGAKNLRRVHDFIAAASGVWEDFESKTRDGRSIETTWAIVRLSDGSSISIGKDITDGKRAEEERKRLLQRLITAHEDERRHLSRELHDNIGQYLSALLLGLESCARLPQLPVAAVDKLSYLKETTKRLELDVHGVALELRPTTLDDLGLEAALSSLTREWARRHEQRITAVFNSTGFTNHAGQLSSDVEVAIYRVVQEALTNVARHSQAGVVSVILSCDDQHVQVIIEDDGVGFDAENWLSSPMENRRLGLMGMQERVQLVGGEFKMESGAGTTIVVSIPLSQSRSAG